jgi:2-iminobutanoate/2-iminopropanoate deaminase
MPSTLPPTSSREGTELPAVLGPYSASTQAGDLLFTSGQTGKLPGTRVVAGSISQQTENCLRNIAAILAHHGLDYSYLVKCNIFLVDMADFEEMNTAYGRELHPNRPARTTVAVAALPLGARVEIEAIARC